MTTPLWRRLTLRLGFSLATIGALLLSAALPFAPGAPALAHGRHAAATAAVGQDWPTYLHDLARTSASAESILTTGNVALLQRQWAYLTGGGIAASPAIVNGVAYI
ncbi:MAG TPA: hypothetical protein VHI51_08795, partial [Ktedonobacterales bacterium]|nr:hypothetical protein [Ktedonobacterales bacterium]